MVNIFKMIDKYGITEDVKPMIVKMAANLETIDEDKIRNYGEDETFNRLNEQMESKEIDMKKGIIKKFV